MTDSVAQSRWGRWGLATAVAVVALLTFAAGANATIFRPTNSLEFQNAVTAANSNSPSFDKIILPPITLSPSAPITITDRLLITGDHAQQSTGDQPGITGASAVPVDADFITVAAGVTADFEGFTVSVASGPCCAAINSFGTLRMDGMEIETNNGQGFRNSGGDVTINNTLISDGGTLAIGGSGTLTLTNSTITDNFGGGIDVNSMPTVMRNTVLSNDAGNCFGTFAAGSTNNFSTDSSCGPSATVGNPNLGTFNFNGGPTLSKAPNPGSPLINAGSNAACPTADQRFFVRPSGQCDIGAVEVGAARDTTAPSCSSIVTRGSASTPDRQDVTLTDSASGLGVDAVFSEEIELLPTTENNGTFSFTPKTAAFRSPTSAPAPSDSGLTVTATKSGGGANNAQKMRWHFTGRDWAGNVRDYATCP